MIREYLFPYRHRAGANVKEYDDLQSFLMILKNRIVHEDDDGDTTPNSYVDINQVDKVITIQITHAYDYITPYISVILVEDLPEDLTAKDIIQAVQVMTATLS